MGLAEILGMIGSLASIEGEIRAIIDNRSREQTEIELRNLYATKDFSILPDDMVDRMDQVEAYLEDIKSEFSGEWLFSQEERAAAVSDFFSSRTDLYPYRADIEPVILRYIDLLEELLLKDMKTGERVLYRIDRRVEKKIDDISEKMDTVIHQKAPCRQIPEPQIRDMIGQKRSELPKDYIRRKVVTHDIAVMDHIERFLASKEPIPLKDAVMKDRWVLLLGDGGHGKSTELKFITCAIYEASLCPCFYSLYSYCGGPIKDILPEYFFDVEPDCWVLIFDGFDEMLEDERREFLRRLLSFLDTYPKARVLISSRSNFCKIETENQSQTFRGFYTYYLDDLTESDINEYIRKQGVDTENFLSEADGVGIYNLLRNPFYLTHLVRLYQDEARLPDKNSVMEQLVQKSFRLDDRKFQDDLEEHRRQLFIVLEKIAFAMQLMHKKAIDDLGVYQELFTSEERLLVKHSSLFQKNGDQWDFVHNNFKEYLAAKYLSKLTKEEVIGFISDELGIRNSWINTLSFLINMDLQWDILGWLLEFSPNVLVKFEPERLSIDTRCEIFKTQFAKFEEDMLRISDSLFTAEELASFGCCEDSLDFLLDRLTHPVNWCSRMSAMELLRYFPCLYGRKQAVAAALLGCCVVPFEGQEALCQYALFALREQELVTPEIAAELVERYQDCDDPRIRWGMYRLLVQSGQHNTHIRFFLDGIDKIKSSDRLADERIALVDGLKAMSEPESVQKAMEYIAQKDPQWMYNADEVYEALCNKAAELYFDGEEEFYPFLLDCYFSSAREALHRRQQASLHFFRVTDTIEAAAVDICVRSKNPAELFGLFDKPDNLDLLKQAYVDGKLQDHTVFHEIVKQFADEERYTEYCELISKIDGVPMPKRKPPVNYRELRSKGQQEYFDMLFHRDRVKRLIMESGLTDPTIQELREAKISYQPESPLWLMKIALPLYFSDDNIKVMSIIDSDSWDELILLEAEKVIFRESEVKISSEQEEYLIRLIRMLYAGGLAERTVNAHREQLILGLGWAVLRLTVHFDLVPEESILLQMIELPDSAFADNGSEGKYSYLEKHLSPERILMCVKDNMTAHRVRDLVLRDHIEYCTRFRCEDVRECVIGVVQDPESDILLKDFAAEYIYHVFGVQAVQRDILPFADEEMLLKIERLCPEISADELQTAMERQFEKTSSTELMTHLLRYQSEAALCEYIRLVESKMAPPEGKNAFPDGPTAAIAAICDVRLLPMLERLMNIAFAPDFQDSEFISLYSSLSNALVECGCRTPKMVLNFLRWYKEELKDNEKAYRFCSYTTNELRRRLCEQQDFPRSVQDVKYILAHQ